MRAVTAVMKRELYNYFATPTAYVVILAFLVMAGVFTFYLGHFFDKAQADLSAFFQYLPWLYLFFLPAVAMGLWAPERQLGTLELLMTLPLGIRATVLGKFFAAWLLSAIALLMTFPLVVTVNYLGEPDNGVIIGAYIGSLLLASVYLAIGGAMSAITRNPVIAFILTLVVCFIFMASGVPVVLDSVAMLPQTVQDFVAGMSLLTHFDAISRGVLDLRDISYFVVVSGFWLFVTQWLVQRHKTA
ncbi:MAG: ABC transporter permease subunit [Oceanospirillaceae bacterium]|nr:ABC transporter permease subunit [Oceanospirillaceae bacterium]MCP5349780.1 ABC transporter permease subunit [Oceanospirillaceae bacterium]